MRAVVSYMSSTCCILWVDGNYTIVVAAGHEQLFGYDTVLYTVEEIRIQVKIKGLLPNFRRRHHHI